MSSGPVGPGVHGKIPPQTLHLQQQQLLPMATKQSKLLYVWLLSHNVNIVVLHTFSAYFKMLLLLLLLFWFQLLVVEEKLEPYLDLNKIFPRRLMTRLILTSRPFTTEE